MSSRGLSVCIPLVDTHLAQTTNVCASTARHLCKKASRQLAVGWDSALQVYLSVVGLLPVRLCGRVSAQSSRQGAQAIVLTEAMCPLLWSLPADRRYAALETACNPAFRGSEQLHCGDRGTYWNAVLRSAMDGQGVSLPCVVTAVSVLEALMPKGPDEARSDIPSGSSVRRITLTRMSADRWHVASSSGVAERGLADVWRTAAAFADQPGAAGGVFACLDN